MGLDKLTRAVANQASQASAALEPANALVRQAVSEMGHDELLDYWSFDFMTADYPMGQLQVVSYQAVEEISALYHFDIQILVDEDDYEELERNLLGRAGTLTIAGHPLSQRVAHGVVTRVDAEGVSGDKDGRHKLSLRLSPALAKLRHRQNSRIYRDSSCKDIVSSLLDSYGIRHEWRISAKHTARDYCVQYQETDYAFIERLLADDGIYFFFESVIGDDRETVVFADDAATCQAIAGSGVLEFSDSEGEMFERGGSVSRFFRRSQIRPGSTRVQRYDFERPRFDHNGKKAVTTETDAHDPSPLEVYDHEQILDGVSTDAALAQQHLEQHRRDARVAFGESRCRALQVGRTFSLTGNPMRKLDDDYLVLRLQHRAVRPEYSDGNLNEKTYGNKFECVPRHITPRPPRPRRERRQILETATVVGPEGSEIHTDHYGRIKVQFHWDREGTHDPHSSCWIRTMQSWAGAGWGTQFIPRVGMEVLVQFLSGDTDAPVVVGAVYNGLNGTPFPLPGSKTVSGIRTRSSRGGGGFNELSFEDRSGYERVYVHAQKDFDEFIEHNRTSTVQNDEVARIGSSQLTQVGVNQSNLVGGDALVTVGINRNCSVGHNDDLNVANMRCVDVGGSSRHSIGRSAELSIGDDATVSVADDMRLFVGGDTELILGDVSGDDRVATVAVHGDVAMSSSASLKLEAEESLELRCGDTVLTLSPDGLTIETPKCQVLADDELLLDSGGAVLKLDDSLIGLGKKAQLQASGSSLVLDANAALDGALVKLNCGPGQASADGETEDDEETEMFQFTAVDATDKPYANLRYELCVGDLRLKGKTDGSGKLKQKIPTTARSAKISLWTNDKSRIDYLVKFEDVPPVTDLKGAQVRLRNLGYYDGDVDGEITHELYTAVRGFQTDYDLKVSGELCGATQDKLEELAEL